MSPQACSRCLARSWLLGRLAGHLDSERARIEALLGLSDEDLITAVGGRRRRRLLTELQERRSHPERGRAPLEAVCRCHELYPPRLRALRAAPNVVHVAGGLARFLGAVGQEPVALVGSRRPSAYGLEVARSLSRELSAAGITVVSGMAFGIDAAAHSGALDGPGQTIAVLPGAADRPYPRQHRRLYQMIVGRGAAVSEMAGPVAVRRWMFPARNRLIAALARMTVVVEAPESSGALLTARDARKLGHPLGAVPGRVTSAQAAGANQLLADGAHIIRGAQDVLDALFGAGARVAKADRRPALAPVQQRLLEALAEAGDTAEALRRAGLEADQGLAAMAALEVDGYVRRGPGGQIAVVP